MAVHGFDVPVMTAGMVCPPSLVSIVLTEKLPSGVRSDAEAFSCASFPGWPLKSFDCLAFVVQVAGKAALHDGAIVTPTSAETLSPRGSATELDAERNATAPFSTVAVQPGRSAAPTTAPRATPLGGVKFAEPSVCWLLGSFVSFSVNVLRLVVASVRRTVAE